MKKFLPFLLTAFLFGSIQQEAKCPPVSLPTGAAFVHSNIVPILVGAGIIATSIIGMTVYFICKNVKKQYLFDIKVSTKDTQFKIINTIFSGISPKNIKKSSLTKKLKKKIFIQRLNKLDIKEGQNITLHIRRKKGNIDLKHTFNRNNQPLSEQLIHEWEVIKEKIIATDSYFDTTKEPS